MDLHVYEQAQIFTELNSQQRARLYRYLTAKEVGDMFDAIEDEPEEVVKYFEEMTPQYVANVIDEMYTDNAVDILAYVPKKDLAGYLRLLPTEKAVSNFALSFSALLSSALAAFPHAEKSTLIDKITAKTAVLY